MSAPMLKLIRVKVCNVYGKPMIYPACNRALLLTQLTGKKTFSPSDLEIISALGFVIEQVVDDNLALFGEVNA